MEKQMIIEKLREHGYRMTRQREVLLDIILEGSCNSSKEIYYKASARDKRIGTATVYRMLNLLEQIGFIRRDNICMLSDHAEEKENPGRIWIELDDGAQITLSEKQLRSVLELGLRTSGYLEKQKIVDLKNC